MNDRARWPLILPLVGVVMVAWILLRGGFFGNGETISWNELKALVEAGEIEEVVLASDVVRAQKKATGEEPGPVVSAVRVAEDEGFVGLLDEHGVAYSAQRRGGCTEPAMLLLMLPMIAVTLLLFAIARRDPNGSGAAAFARSSAKLVPEEGTGITFADVAGADEAAEELQEIVSFLKTPERFTSLGGRPPKGVLLVGPPGTGKTLLARAVAGEAKVPFLSISGSAFVEMFVGVGAARVRDLFKTATEHAPCIIFIDELDAVGKTRLSGAPSNDEREQTLNQLLVEMDGFDNRGGIIVMAATNRPETLDSALLRPGRFDRQVVVDRPDLRGRVDILKVHAKKLVLDGEVDLEAIAQLTPGFAGADLANALNEAALLAARRGATAVALSDVKDAIERIVAGLEKKNRRLSPIEKKTVAYHECGHAICAASSPGADPVQKISIIPRGVGALGYTIQMPLEDRYLMTKAELLNRITVLYGGRSAEELIFGDVTTGAHDDIRKATDLARRMVTEYGMSKRLGAVNYAETAASPFGYGGPVPGAGSNTSPETAEVVEAEVRAILERCHKRSRQILHDNRVLLEEMAAHLLDREVLDGTMMQNFLARARSAESLEDRPITETEELTAIIGR
jgi:cell division protease FtsH